MKVTLLEKNNGIAVPDVQLPKWFKVGYTTSYFGSVDATHLDDLHRLLGSSLTLYWMQQTHSSRVFILDSSTNYLMTGVDADGLVTNQAGVVLLGRFADCWPLILCGVESKIIGIAHVGWRGLIRGILTSLVSAFNRLGASIQSLVALLGPGICASCYSVKEDFLSFVSTVRGRNYTQTFTKYINAVPYFDIAAAIRNDLCELGVLKEKIYLVDECTYESDFFYSYRRNGTSARFAAFCHVT
jgi:YfiH family protein